jgi:hypothetical protein
MNRDNQQITVELKKAWLAGIWDGEGTFSIVRQNRREYRNREMKFGLTPKLTMENTSVDIIDECCLILDQLNIAYYISDRKEGSKKHKRRYVVQVCRFTEIVKFCEMISPFIVSKKLQLELLKEFSLSRAMSRKNGKRIPYTDREYVCAEQLRELNELGSNDISTTIRKTLARQLETQSRWLTKRNEKIESDLYGDIQKSTEMIDSRRDPM